MAKVDDIIKDESRTDEKFFSPDEVFSDYKTFKVGDVIEDDEGAQIKIMDVDFKYSRRGIEPEFVVSWTNEEGKKGKSRLSPEALQKWF